MEQPAPTIEAAYHRIPVLLEDDEIIAIDKPCGLASIPERNPSRPSLLSILEQARRRRYYVVHRLDKQVSGVILFAKSAAAHRHLNLQFERRKVEKTYFALIHGALDPDSGTIEIPLRRFGSGRMGADPVAGKPCATAFRVVRRSAQFTRIEIFPLTGRKHQIRAHFFSIGHPVVGDPLYGEKSLQRAYPRIQLHAARLAFVRASGERVEVISLAAADFVRMLDGLMT
jgi:RluA family pseudouridine synthase